MLKTDLLWETAFYITFLIDRSTQDHIADAVSVDDAVSNCKRSVCVQLTAAGRSGVSGATAVYRVVEVFS